MSGRSYNNYGSFRPMPKPVGLDIPESRNGYNGSRRREVRPLPRFEDDRYGGAVRERTRRPVYDKRRPVYDQRGYDDGWGYEPEKRERLSHTYREPRGDIYREPRGDTQRRRRPPQPNNPPAKRRPAPRRQETPVRQGLLALAGINFAFKFNPLYRQIAIVVTSLVTIIAVSIILIANAFNDNALAVFVDGEHIGYIEITAGWSSEAFHDEAIMELQGRRGVGVNVEETVTLEPTRASSSDIVSRSAMLSQIANNHFSYKLSAVAIYAFDSRYRVYRREALMRSMADVYSTKYMLTQRFLTSNTVYYGFDPDWRLVPVEVDDENARFSTPQEAFARLDRRIRTYVEYVVQSGDTLIGIARAWDMELAELVRINSIVPGTNIMPGQRLNVVTQAPLLSVITIEETSRVEVLQRTVEPIYVDTLPPAVVRVRQEGSDGEHTVITRTTRRGIVVIYEEELPGEVITPAVPRIQEVGR